MRSPLGPIAQLVQLKGHFDRDSARCVRQLLRDLCTARLRRPDDLIGLHEAALYFRAYPHDASVLRAAEAVLAGFAPRLANLDLALFEDPDRSGIAGTSVSAAFSYEFARLLAGRHALHIDWDNYEHPERLGPVLARLIPGAAEDWTVEPHVDWRAWLEGTWEAARATVPWLLDRLDPLTYDLLEIPVRVDLGTTAAARTLTRLPHRETFYHRAPLLRRADVSIAAEFAAPHFAVRRLNPAHARRIHRAIATTSAVRYRELWGFSHPDLDHFYRADFGRGVEFYFCGVPREFRLPLRAYHCGMFFKNGVPIGYFEGLSFFERMEAGFNLYPTFREGETAWLYARTLKLFHEQLGIAVFSVDPYQIGDHNEEAIDSGAFWFYRKLGFRPLQRSAAALLRQEEKKLTADPAYRTPPATLRRLARAALFYGPAEDWANFSIHQFAKRWKSHPKEIARAKNAPEESTYLRTQQRTPALRRKILTPDS